MKKRILISSAIVASILFLEAGCVSSNDPNKRSERALAGGATSTAIGVATGIGGPILAARVALGAVGRVVTGEATDKYKKKKEEKEQEEVNDVIINGTAKSNKLKSSNDTSASAK